MSKKTAKANAQKALDSFMVEVLQNSTHLNEAKPLVGEAKRKSDQAKARAIVKPTAEQLGVSAVVGSRGKVRSENEKDTVKLSGDKFADPILESLCADKPFGENVKLSKAVPQSALNEWATEQMSHHAAEGYSQVKEIERRLGQPWWSVAEKNETLQSLIFRAIKALTIPPQTVAQTAPAFVRTETPKEIILSGPKPVQAVKIPSPKEKKEGPSNKEIVYREWLKSEITPDIAIVAKLVPDVQVSSIKSWMNAWEAGNNLPACAKELPPPYVV